MPVHRVVTAAAQTPPDTLLRANPSAADLANSPVLLAWQLLFRAVWFLITWIAAPLLLLGMFAFAVRILRKIRNREQLISARAGLWCGIVAAMIVVANQSSQFVPPSFPASTGLTMNLLFAAFGGVAGFCFLWVVKALLPTRVVGLLVLVLSFASLTSLYAYFFIVSLRILVFPAALGLAFGAWFHQVIFPGALLANLSRNPEAELPKTET